MFRLLWPVQRLTESVTASVTVNNGSGLVLQAVLGKPGVLASLPVLGSGLKPSVAASSSTGQATA